MTGIAGHHEVTLAHGGCLRGCVQAGLHMFKGIRYAQAPFGPLRFQAPVPQPAWQGVRDALAFAPAAPQLPRVAHAHTPVVGGPDCLALNIWAPADRAGPLPVMVWVHGGGFFRGAASDPLYDGAAWARQGVVFVSMQYRLGIDGFLHMPGAPANRGLLDIVAALRWVQQHIAAWGGDAGQVTVMGQSAGAGALACLLGMPQTLGLFQRAILQSPSVACQTLQESAAAREAVAALAGVAPQLDALAHAPLAAVLQAVHRLAIDPALRRRLGLGGRQFFPLRPVVDGEVLSAPPLQAMHRCWAAHPGQASALRVLVGSNADEMRLYHVPTGLWDDATPSHVDAFAQDAELPAALVAAYRTSVDGGRATPGALLAALQADHYYRVPALGIARLAARWAGGTHRYSFEWPSPQARGRLGAAHAVELPFVFANLDTPQGLEFTGAQPPVALSETMHRAWAQFAVSGDPGWPAFTDTQSWTMRFGSPPFCTDQPEDALLHLWDALT